ncbi:MAG TPA: DUF4846 domain-containing protein [Candidatus Binatia bacterium]|nr:DUF4846 domain-containing protein [Candidatus Binatia bacterium]
MKTACLIGVAALFCASWCRQNAAPQQAGNNASGWLDPHGMTVEERIRVPRGFVRVPAANDSFAAYLRQLPLKPHQTPVRLYNGLIKANRGAHDAVVDLAIGDRDLHQCADAVIRLRAEYLFRQKQFGRIHFFLTNGFRMDYDEWRKGKRLVVHGNRTHWEQRRGPNDSEADFWNYLEVVFSYAGTLSLAKELKPAGLADMQIGDVFIQGGSPGHAVIVIDLAVDPQSGEKRFVLAQSYMPAQEIHVLRNPGDPGNSPWYGAGRGEDVRTPEWVFRSSDLKRFAEP